MRQAGSGGAVPAQNNRVWAGHSLSIGQHDDDQFNQRHPCKNDWWGDPFYLKFWVKLIAFEQNRRF